MSFRDRMESGEVFSQEALAEAAKDTKRFKLVEAEDLIREADRQENEKAVDKDLNDEELDLIHDAMNDDGAPPRD